MIHVLYTIPNLDTAGSGKALANLVGALDPEGFRATVAVDRLAGTALEATFAAMGVEIVEAPVRVEARPVATLPTRARRRGRKRSGLGADLWHSFHYLDDYTEPLVAHAAGARWVWTKKNMSWNRRSWRLRTRWADGVIAQNTDMLERFFTGRRARRRTVLIPRGVPVPAPVDAAQAAVARTAVGVPDGVPLITCPARLQPRKRQHVLVRALAHVPDAHVVLAGREVEGYGAEVARAAREAGVADRVHRPGHLEDLDPLLSASTVVCLPTGPAAEGSPVALLEAMAAGRPVVATRVPGTRDIVRHGTDGLLAEPDDPVDLARSLLDVLTDDDLATRLGDAARRRVVESHSIEQEARSTEAWYRVVLERG